MSAKVPRALLAACCLVLGGCSGIISEPGGFPAPSGAAGGEAAGGAGTGTGGAGTGGSGGSGGSGPNVACDTSLYPSVTIAGLAEEFARDVQPAMARMNNGCVACHAINSGRLFTVAADGTETFYKARSGGYFLRKPGSILDRLITQDAAAQMPRSSRWEKENIEALAHLACKVQAFEEQGGLLPDEEFPPNLLTPFTGTKPTTYENTFINSVQLEGRVKQVFNDDWVRGGVDKFAANLSSFGGVNFTTTFVEARVATPEFLLGLDLLAPDVCQQAATAKTGPFTGLDLVAPIVDSVASTTQTFEAEAMMPSSGSGQGATGGYLLYTNGTLTTAFTTAGAGSFEVTVRAYGSSAGGVPPNMDLIVDGQKLQSWAVSNAAPYAAQPVFTIANLSAGAHVLSVGFTNDGAVGSEDRNLWVDNVRLVGPTGASTGTARVDAAKAKIDTLYTRMFYRKATAAELTDTFTLLKDLVAIANNLPDSWAGVCEALVRHPDFLWTLPPSHAVATGADRTRLQLVKLANDLLGRTPTAAEVTALDSGAKSYAALVDQYLASPDFKAYFFNRVQLRTESDGKPIGDEPARLWTYIATNDRPFFELLTGEYFVDPSYVKQPRPAEHGKTGLLTMKGYLSNKQGLPHYNYAARVFTDFMGSVFEVPPEVFAQRGASTAASTVDPKSVCFSCHQNLTPISYQRLRWADDGTYSTTDAQGQPIDDSDRQLVPTYGFKGRGLEAFSTVAVKKEAFIRRTINAHHIMMFGRELRHLEDERVIYKQLWDVTQATNGNIRALLKAIALSDGYLRN